MGLRHSLALARVQCMAVTVTYGVLDDLGTFSTMIRPWDPRSIAILSVSRLSRLHAAANPHAIMMRPVGSANTVQHVFIIA